MSFDETPYRKIALEFVAELQADVAAVLKEHTQLAPEMMDKVGLEVAGRVGKRWAGMRVYFPRSLVIDQTHWDIYQAWNGHNKVELMRRYEISEVWFDQIIKRCRLADRERRQVDMFPLEASDPSV